MAKKNIYIGITYSHNATVAVIKNNEIIFAQSEERFNRIKNSTGFPFKTLEYIYKNICSEDEVKSITIFQKSIFGYLSLKKQNFKPYKYGFYFTPDISQNNRFWKSELKWNISQIKARKIKENNKLLVKESFAFWEESSKVKKGRINLMDHHNSHAYSVLSNIKDWGKTLIFTLDGAGDYKCGSVKIFSKERKNLETLLEIDHRNSLGYFYSAITVLLGMKAGEHEFKVMGLAPYTKYKYFEKILIYFRELYFLDEKGSIQAKYNPVLMHEKLLKIIQGERFDNIAAAAQMLVEELIISWIQYWVSKYGIKNIALSGGVFMNVKACQKVIENINPNKIFIMPSAGDESCAIGCAIKGYMEENELTNLKPLKSLYLGVEYGEKDLLTTLNNHKYKHIINFNRLDNINLKVAELLRDGHVVARCSGKMEFGARALGNRSILADPSKIEVLELINSTIKSRDFWMPFTPSILSEDIELYVKNYKSIFAPYMCVTFNSTELAQNHLKAALHPRDKTIRPQEVIKEWNPGYYDLISQFKGMTGIGGVLNTSFNLHGEPNVCSHEDAIHTLLNSNLKYLVIDSYLIEKK